MAEDSYQSQFSTGLHRQRLPIRRKTVLDTGIKGIDLSGRPARWHPKITPYRLVFIFSTIVLGITKAVLVYQGKTMGSITIEWVTGVLVSLILYVLGLYEADRTYPRYMAWMFTYDCMDIFWFVLNRLLSVQRPGYSSEEQEEYSQPYATGYRLFVSFCVAVFGTVKAACSYFGLNSAANAFDWIIATVISTLLYCIGLYEMNTINLVPRWFETEYSPVVYKWSTTSIKITLFGSGFLFFAAGSVAAIYILTLFITRPLGHPSTFVEYIGDWAAKIPFLTLISVMALASAAVGCFAFWKIFTTIYTAEVHLPNGRPFRDVMKAISRPNVLVFGHLFVHLATHLFAILILGCLSIGGAMILLTVIKFNPKEDGLFIAALCLFNLCLVGFLTGYCVLGTLKFVRSLGKGFITAQRDFLAFRNDFSRIPYA